MSVKVGAIPTRECVDCGLHSEDLSLFVKDKQSKYLRRNLCNNCAIKRNKSFDKLKDWKTDHQTKKRYGIDAETYKRLMATSSCCQICNSTEELCYDHCHTTMKFRGVLCRKCNRSIGQLGDNSLGLQKALSYLLKAENE